MRTRTALQLAFLRSVALALVFAVPITSGAQQPAGLSKKEAAVKRKADSLAAGARVTVVPVQGDKIFGDFLSHDENGLMVRDIDRKMDVTLRYAEVRKLKNGYGGYNSARGRHTDRRSNLIAAVIFLGALGGLIGALAAAKD